MAENKTETEITMLTIKEAAALVQGLTEFRIRELCKTRELPCIMAGKKYLINCIFRFVSAHKPFVLCMVSAETVHGERLNCAWIPRG